MKKRINRKSIFIGIVIIILTLYLGVSVIFKGHFYIHVYDSQTKEYLSVNYPDISVPLCAICVGTPGTNDVGPYMFEPKIAMPGSVSVKVKGYKSRKVIGFLGFESNVKVYLERIDSDK